MNKTIDIIIDLLYKYVLFSALSPEVLSRSFKGKQYRDEEQTGKLHGQVKGGTVE